MRLQKWREASFKGVATMAMWPGSIQLFIGGDRILPRLGPKLKEHKN